MLIETFFILWHNSCASQQQQQQQNNREGRVHSINMDCSEFNPCIGQERLVTPDGHSVTTLQSKWELHVTMCLDFQRKAEGLR